MIIFSHDLATRLIKDEGILMGEVYEVLGFKLRTFPSYHPNQSEDEGVQRLWQEEVWVETRFWAHLLKGKQRLFTLKVDRHFAPIITMKGKAMALSLDKKVLNRIVFRPRAGAYIVPLKDSEIMFRVLHRLEDAGASHVIFFVTPNVNEELPMSAIWSIIHAGNLGDIPDAIQLSRGTSS